MTVLPKPKEPHSKFGSKLRDFILGWQDGLVNVLGIVLGIATATASTKLIIISGLVAASAEAISMSAVAYTSTKAEINYYNSELEKERREVEEVPEIETKEIRDIYFAKGFRGKLLNDVVKKIISNKKVWIDTMMQEELKLSPTKDNPVNTALIVLIAAMVAALIPLVPFLFWSVSSALIYAIVLSVIVLFVTGAIEARITIGSWKTRGLEMAVIGTVAALLGYAIGKLLGANL